VSITESTTIGNLKTNQTLLLPSKLTTLSMKNQRAVATLRGATRCNSSYIVSKKRGETTQQESAATGRCWVPTF